MRATLLVPVVIVCAVSALFADQITLTNGDRLTGTIVKSDGKELTLKTDYAGEVVDGHPGYDFIRAASRQS